MKNHREAARQACIEGLEPLIKILLENGMSYKEFAELCKVIFVDVAQKNYGIRGRPANTAKVSAITGIDRKQIKRITDQGLQADLLDLKAPLDRITRVLSAWYEEDLYVDKSTGKPIVLPLDTDDPEKPSLMKLIKGFCGDVPATTILKELKNNQCIREVSPQCWEVLTREYISPKTDAQAIIRTGKVLQDLGSVIHHNLYVADGEKVNRFFERRTTNENIPKKYAAEFNDILNDEGQKFLDQLDNWLIEKQVPEVEPEDKKFIRLGVGMYFISSDNADSKK